GWRIAGLATRRRRSKLAGDEAARRQMRRRIGGVGGGTSIVDQRQQRALAAVDQDWIVALPSDPVRIPSLKGDETRLARGWADWVGQRGYEVALQEVSPGRLQTIARLQGTGGGKSIMFNGHLDIDPLAMGWKHDPWEPAVEGDRLYGAGIMNMKG